MWKSFWSASRGGRRRKTCSTCDSRETASRPLELFGGTGWTVGRVKAGHQPRLDRFLTESARGRLKIAKRDTGYGLSHEDEQTASSLESVYDGAILLVLVLSLFLPAVPATMTPCVSCL